MKKLTTAIVAAMFCLALQVHAQQENAGNDKQAAGAQQKEDVAEPGTLATADTPLATEADSTQESNNYSALGDAPASGSSSPAMLSAGDGKEPDGNNTVQRASMNMAGAPATNLNLGNNEPVDASSEMADRQATSQGKEISSQKTGSGTAVNSNNRRANDAMSDQTRSSKNKDASETLQKENKKEKRSKRKKDRG